MSVGRHASTAAASFSGKPKRQDASAFVPVKDRAPMPLFDPNVQKTRLAVLVDAELVSLRSYVNVVKPQLDTLGYPILIRLFSYDLKQEWQADVINKRMEWFRVERFIPIHVQIAADAAHIARFAEKNYTQAVCYVVTHAEMSQYDAYVKRPEMVGVAAYCIGDAHRTGT